MMTDSLAAALVTGVLSGGAVSGAATLYRARLDSRKAPVERDSIVVSGAETAVLALERTLSAETRRADRAEAKNLEYEKKVENLQTKLDTLQDALNSARDEIQGLIAATKH